MDIEKAKKIINDIFTFINSPIDSLNYEFIDKKGHYFSINSSKFESLYGNDVFERDLMFILKKIISKNNDLEEGAFKCTIDINNRQSKLDDLIRIKALKAAEAAKKLKMDIIMDSMSSYERMIVHSTLAGEVDITTGSEGIGKDRKIIVKYLAI